MAVFKRLNPPHVKLPTIAVCLKHIRKLIKRLLINPKIKHPSVQLKIKHSLNLWGRNYVVQSSMAMKIRQKNSLAWLLGSILLILRRQQVQKIFLMQVAQVTWRLFGSLAGVLYPFMAFILKVLQQAYTKKIKVLLL